MNILAKNQSEKDDETQKADAALACKQDLIRRGIDVEAYHSLSIAKDIHALKTQLGYDKWNIYGVSYGTYVSQVYASNYPEDIESLILDSAVAEISEYYTQNTSNYIKSLSKVFKMCLNDSDCNARYPDLESIYYKTISDLEKQPITVSVDKKLIESGEFTYNSEDFKVAIQQALYNKQLIEVLPLLIYQFHNKNEDALGNLVAAFSSLLGMDYGVYYCVSCNETLPNNTIADYQKDVLKYKNINGGVSFYKSDFKVCDQWNLSRKDSTVYHDLSALKELSSKVMIISGEFDPITPVSNADKLSNTFKNSYAITGHTYGHTPGFTRIGNQVAEAFVSDPNTLPSFDAFKEAKKLNFVKGVTINPGVSKVGNSLNQINIIFLAPLLIALTIILVFIFTYITKLIKKRYQSMPDRIIRIFSTLTSLFGISGFLVLVLALLKVSGQNYFVLAFGLPDNFNYVFTILLVFTALLVLTLLYFMIQIRKIQDRSIVFSVLFFEHVISYLFILLGSTHLSG